jgi:hypothetical protein
MDPEYRSPLRVDGVYDFESRPLPRASHVENGREHLSSYDLESDRLSLAIPRCHLRRPAGPRSVAFRIRTTTKHVASSFMCASG